MEYNFYSKIIQKHNILGYYRYVNDIPIIFDYTLTDINLVLHEFNQVNSHIQFTLELEINKHKLSRPNNPYKIK